MLIKNQIDNWIQLYELSDNKKDFIQDSFSSRRVFLKRDLVEAKIQIDRWSAVTNTWIFHSSKKDMIHSLFPKDADYKDSDAESLKAALRVLIKYAGVIELGIDLKGRSIDDLTSEELVKISALSESEKTFHIWGADVHFTDDIDPNIAIGLSLNKDGLTLMSNGSDNLANSIIVFNVS
jgi:hypothetical protein